MRFLSLFLLFAFLGGSGKLYPQRDDSQKLKSLEELVAENQKLYKTQPEAALAEIDELIKIARDLKKDTMELVLLANKTEYSYFFNTDLEQMLSTAMYLQNRARSLNNSLYEAIAHKYQAQAYAFNEMYDRAKSELQMGLDILDNADKNNQKIIMQKAAFYTNIANVYNQKEEYFNSLNSLFNSLKEHKKLKDKELRRGTQFMDYSSIGGAYYQINQLDSAEYYTQKSISLTTEKEARHTISFVNFLTMGNIRLKQEKYDESLVYYRKAEEIKENQYHLNIEDLYNGFIRAYNALDDTENKAVYENKLKDLKIKVLGERNESMQKMVESSFNNAATEVPDRSKNILFRIIIFALALIGLSSLAYILKNQKKQRNITTKHSKPEGVSDKITLKNFEELNELIHNNDQRFLLRFQEIYPDFHSKFLEINNDFSNMELELAAMLKMNLTTKEIANIRNLSYRTVQNMRYHLRKKLKLSSETDLETWIQNFI